MSISKLKRPMKMFLDLAKRNTGDMIRLKKLEYSIELFSWAFHVVKIFRREKLECENQRES